MADWRMSECFWPPNEPRIHAMVTNISAPLSLDHSATITLLINNRNEVHGEITFVLPRHVANQFRIGDVYAAYFRLVGGMAPA